VTTLIPNRILELALKQIKKICPKQKHQHSPARFVRRAKEHEDMAWIKWPKPACLDDSWEVSVKLSPESLAFHWNHSETGWSDAHVIKIPPYEDPDFKPEEIIALIVKLAKDIDTEMREIIGLKEEIRRIEKKTCQNAIKTLVSFGTPTPYLSRWL